jgi:excinuclease ABC subunit A
MKINIQGAREHNLQSIDVEIGEDLTVITGVSGSGKTSLAFDTLYHEARRRFLEIYSLGSSALRLSPANVDAISGLGPAMAVAQNILNRNPNSSLATACGLHPFLRLLYANFGGRRCYRCGEELTLMSTDEIVAYLGELAAEAPLTVYAPLVQAAVGSHQSLLELLEGTFGADSLLVDGARGYDHPLQVIEQSAALGANVIRARRNGEQWTFPRAPVCTNCGTWFEELSPVHFHTGCPHCGGDGCPRCDNTGLHPQAAAVRWQGLHLPALLAQSVDQVRALFQQVRLPDEAQRLQTEILSRLDALHTVGLGYISLNRPSPTLSRGEAQRVRLALALTSRLEDLLHVLDEPTIGQHPADVARLMPAFRRLAGPVVYVEHDRMAAAHADRALDLGPGAGEAGGKVVFNGAPSDLWEAETSTGRYFSMRARVPAPQERPPPKDFLTVRSANLRNLSDIDVPIPLRRMTVISGVSGSGKSTLVEDVLVATLTSGKPSGCQGIDGPSIKPLLVDQSPIGKNPRSNPATYTKLSDILRDLFASLTGLSASHFSFNRPEGACPICKGMGAVEVKMRYLPSTWIPCSECGGQRFKDEVLEAHASFGDRHLSIADFYQLSVSQSLSLLEGETHLSNAKRRRATRLLRALDDIGLGYLPLGQPSPTLSGGEAQRVKLARYLGRGSLAKRLLVLDEPSTGLHPQDLAGLLTVLDRLVRSGASVVVVEHNTDIIRAADWVIDLGPGAGPEGGRLIYAGTPARLLETPESLTGQALKNELEVHPRSVSVEHHYQPSASIRLRGARAHNLQNVDVDIPKGALTVVTGVSGSGKSSLVGNVLEAEARRRFLETLSLYERQGTREGPQAPLDTLDGLGVALTVTPERRLYERRATVGTASEISHHLAVLLALIGERPCPQCGTSMVCRATWVCPACGCTASIAKPRHFSPNTYAAACLTCHGVGTLQIPQPDKLIIHPEKPLCEGAMHSPGFFPQGYLCQPYNHGYYIVKAIAERHGFDPVTTPWNEMTPEAQHAFLFGDPEPVQVHAVNRAGQHKTYESVYPGFYGWVRDWDIGGTYTNTRPCPDCQGARLRPEYTAVTLNGRNIHELSEMPLKDLPDALQGLAPDEGALAVGSLETIHKRALFLIQVGLGYLHLNRITGTLSAGEAQRVKLAGLLGSGLTSLTVLLDEPSRGMHPSEIEALLNTLETLRDEGNTVIVVEHDPLIMHAADHLIDMGPGAGVAGGQVVAQGEPTQVAHTDTLTARWLRGQGRILPAGEHRQPSGWMHVRGARANNLQIDELRLPLGVLVGVCGVSGSGKSSLLVDTLGRALAPKKHTTSVASEPLEPGEHDEIRGAPRRTVLVDQSRAGVRSPLHYLDLAKPLRDLYAESQDARAQGIDAKRFSESCEDCKGRGYIKLDMGFLPDVEMPCETCRASGHLAEIWQVRLGGLALPELYTLTLDEVYHHFGGHPKLGEKLQAARAVGLGYLVLRQPGYALSGGEAQRLKIARELARKTPSATLYILDEPTVGQHLEDVGRLVGVLHKLVEGGGSVIVIEHHPHLLAACDWLVELGPGGGPGGGRVIASGRPGEVARMDTPSAPYLRQVLEVGA